MKNFPPGIVAMPGGHVGGAGATGATEALALALAVGAVASLPRIATKYTPAASAPAASTAAAPSPTKSPAVPERAGGAWYGGIKPGPGVGIVRFVL